MLVEASADASRCTKKLLRYARHLRADLVALGTSGKRAVSRWFAGSFAQTMFLESPLPLLIAGPGHVRLLSQGHRKVMIVPTEFDESERAGFEHLLRVARRDGLKLRLMRRNACALESFAAAGLHTLGGGWVPAESVLADECSRDLAKAQDWLRRAREAGVDARVVTENFRESTAQAILDFAKKFEGASPSIALSKPEAMTSSFRTLMRDLIRQSPYPIYLSGQI